jgi:hypothetical protein
MHFSLPTSISLSLAPGFSPVWDWQRLASRFNGFASLLEAAEAADEICGRGVTGLKPGANEENHGAGDFGSSLQP